ncbi:sodium-dependent transporter [Bacillus sp. Marseille-P3661]|uniref:sodium-dependent transporter n=1 Tax=Bacillus sp. Marseille-P3661 TaxID=1936234 RepID=UPI000C831461|nr:sodium-dependent transporter [Bacillus sp. Marseille-P3661]
MKQENQWSSKVGFVLASAGAAIGLGAIWKFPYVAGMNGGGAFFLIFIVFTLLIGLPMLISEFLIGRSTGKEAISAYEKLAPKSVWTLIGRMGVVGCFLLLTFYAVVGGWVLIYTIASVFGLIIQEGVDFGATFGYITSSPWLTLVSTAAFLMINIIVIALGIKDGIEKASKYMMPLLFLFFLILVVRALTLEGAIEGVSFFLMPDFTKITAEGILYALGQSFFALAVGFSCMVTYSSYLGKEVSIPKSANTIVFMNITVSLLAGLAIFPVVFAFGFEPTEGPGLLFIVLPAVFSQMTFGEVFLAIFLILFLFATLTSSFSLLEIMVAAFTNDGNRSRTKVAWIAGIIVFVAGIPAGLSSGIFSEVTLFNITIFDLTDFLVSNIMLPLGCLLIALFITMKVDRSLLKKEFNLGFRLADYWYNSWWFLMRVVVPITIIIVFLSTLGVI